MYLGYNLFPFIQVAAQQQYVPVSMVEQSGRQMLLTVSVQFHCLFQN
jgi:hypothetical protein